MAPGGRGLGRAGALVRLARLHHRVGHKADVCAGNWPSGAKGRHTSWAGWAPVQIHAQTCRTGGPPQAMLCAVRVALPTLNRTPRPIAGVMHTAAGTPPP